MPSVLMHVAAKEQPFDLSEPHGVYDAEAQMWSIVSKAKSVGEGLEIFAATSQPMTYSGTTAMGKDNDSDDRGS